MDDISDKISSMLSDPESMERILNVVKSMGISSDDKMSEKEKEGKESIQASYKEADTEEKAPQGSGNKNPLSSILASPELERLFGSGNKERCALLSAMGPFLSISKRERLEEIVKTLKLIDMFYGAKELL